MEVSFHSARCYICFKKFEIPVSAKSELGRIYIDYTNREFRCYLYKNSGNRENIIGKYIDSDVELQVENDNTRGHVAIEMLGVLADGNFKPVYSYINCPRCSLKFHSISRESTKKEKLNQLTFNFIKNKNDEEMYAILVDRWNKDWVDYPDSIG